MSDKECNECEDPGNGETKDVKRISIGRTPYFQKHYATRVGVTLTDFDIRLDIMNEKFKDDVTNKEVLVVEQMVILTPLAAKELSIELQRIIKHWEEKNPIHPRPDKSIFSQYEVE